jgi:two-component system, OmpR family, response regulator
MHVLIADDDQRVLSMLSSYLARRGHTVTTLHGGLEVRGVIEQNSDIELVILNWMLPGLDGLVLSRELKDAGVNIQTVVMVGGSFRSEVENAFASWADRFVSKPLNSEGMSVLLESIEATVNNSSRKVSGRTVPLVRDVTAGNQWQEFKTSEDLLCKQNVTARWN